ncbi:MAG: 50S ribosome-binding GTPase [Oscillospiraceae bacterium]|nr:50S ribosome-binding GTPase [Oscillospiraceae bacterium]
MEYHPEQLAAKCLQEINQKIRNLKKLNIVILGKSGVGKSTLINSVFRENLAKTGIGRPVTQEIRSYTKPDFPLTIYDTPGFELGKEQQDKTKKEVLELIRNGASSDDVNKAIHCIWYCINVGSNRTFDSFEEAWLREFTEENKITKVPIFIILTQACPKKKALEMQKLVEAENFHISKVVPVLAQDMELDEDYTVKAYGLNTLIDLMTQVLPDDLQDTLQNVQKASLDAKKKRAQAIVAGAVATAFGEGFVPVPFADAAMLVPTQVTMLASITAVFGMNISKSLLTCFVSSTIGAGGATILGRTIVSNLLKLTGVGAVLGGTISGTTAGLLTTALGEAYIKILEMIFKGEMRQEELDTPEGKKKIKDLFLEFLKKNKN